MPGWLPRLDDSIKRVDCYPYISIYEYIPPKFVHTWLFSEVPAHRLEVTCTLKVNVTKFLAWSAISVNLFVPASHYW